MKGIAFLSGLISSLLTSGIVLPAVAQVTSDGTTNTTVNLNGNNFDILNGIQKGNNLFHSFKEFSIPTGGSATFDLTNTSNINTIFSRVTGGNISNIDGLIQTLNSSNPVSLFLMNPNGIVFGANGSLNIGGSFIGTTAESINFADGLKFSATDTTTTPLLTISVPVGLQMGNNPGAIHVQGKLQVPTEHTLALVGSQIDMTGANLTASDGYVELWAVGNAEITTNTQPWQLISPNDTAEWGTITLQQISLVDASGINGGAINVRGRGLTLQDGSNIVSNTSAGQGKGITIQTTEFVDLLGNSAPFEQLPFSVDQPPVAVDQLPVPSGQPAFPGIKTSVGNSLGFFVLPGPSATGQAGNITIETGRLKMTDGAWIHSTISGNNSKTGDITVRAADVDLLGYENLSGLSTSTIANLLLSGSNNQSGQVTVDAQRVRLFNGSRISSSVLGGNGAGGEVSIRASESLEIKGANPIGVFSAVLASLESGTTGQGGSISIDTGSLILSNGGGITSEVVGSQINFLSFMFIPSANGTAGDIDIRAKDIQVSEPMIDGFSQTITGIKTSLGNGSLGSGGSINLTADNLRVFNGGQITSSTDGNGAAGNVNLQVKNIDVQGISQPLSNGQILPSSITASSTTDFAAGSVNIQSANLRVRDRAEITVSNTGSGNAGNLNINSNKIFLDNGGTLQAEVNGGSQGNIKLEANDGLILRRGGNITTNATGTSTGGNIDITAGVIAAVSKENSDIVANAVLGSGGKINITTQGIFGLEFRDELTEKSDITASSEFGVSGTVDINNFSIDPSSGLVELPVALSDSSQQIATGCSNNSGSSFVATGRGGIPQNPTEQVNESFTWSDIRDLSAYRKPNSNNQATQISNKPAIVEATGFIRNADGEIELVASKPTPFVTKQVSSCSGAST